MPPKVFVLGVTGYIGGDATYAINEAHPEWELTCLVRNSDKGAKVASVYPKTKLVYGDLDSIDLITEESAKADIVYTFADCDHQASAEAAVKGLQSKSTPSFLIHTSGTGILTYETTDLGAQGKALAKVYNDFDGVSEVTSIPERAPHRKIDQIVLAGGTDLVHTAIVCPPTIYGVGRGPGNQDSIQANLAAREIMKHGEGFSILGNENIWCQIHVADLSDLYMKLGENAAQGGGKATWGKEGYYFAEQGSFVWMDIIAGITKAAHDLGLVKSEAVRSLSVEEVKKITPRFIGMIGGNSICDAIRARHDLGWKPSDRKLIDTVSEVVEREAKKLGLVKGHAERVAAEVQF